MGPLMLLMLLLAGTTDLLAAEAAHDTHGHGVSGHRDNLPVYWVIPFAGMLLSIAVFPLVRPHFWHQHYGKVTIFWSLVMGIPFMIFHGKGGHALYEIMHIVLLDYVPFIILLLALFTAAGGTHDNWDEYDRSMREDKRSAVIVVPERIYGSKA